MHNIKFRVGVNFVAYSYRQCWNSNNPQQRRAWMSNDQVTQKGSFPPPNSKLSLIHCLPRPATLYTLSQPQKANFGGLDCANEKTQASTFPRLWVRRLPTEKPSVIVLTARVSEQRTGRSSQISQWQILGFKPLGTCRSRLLSVALFKHR